MNWGDGVDTIRNKSKDFEGYNAKVGGILPRRSLNVKKYLPRTFAILFRLGSYTPKEFVTLFVFIFRFVYNI